MLPDPAAGGRVRPGLAAGSIAGFWLFFVALSTARSLVLNPPGEQFLLLGLRLVVGAASALVTLALWAALQRIARWSTARQVTAAGLLCGLGAAAFALVNAAVFRNVPPCGPAAAAAAQTGAVGLPVIAGAGCQESLATLFAEHVITGYFLMATWAALSLALRYAAEAGRWERHAAGLRAAAQTAELRALRYQINPHFLFNTLNSLSTLVMAGRPAEAEEMILSLSTYFRASIAFDPAGDVTLGEEIEMQSLYLGIEARRFPRRLRTEVDLPAALADARIPGMLLQPLVENAVKHGVARSREVTTVRIAAAERPGRLLLRVEDDAVAAASPAPGTGIGLRNVADRLEACYGADAACRWEAPADGGFLVELDLPLVRDAG